MLTVSVTQNGTPYTNPAYFILPQPDGRIIFHLGMMDPPPPADGNPANCFVLGLHHVKITDGTTVLFDNDIPNHWWNSAWTFRPPLTIKKTAADLVAARRMFPYGDTGVKLAAIPARVPYVNPFDTSDITLYEPTTGEDKRIGLLTDNSALFMLGLDNLRMLDWAQAGHNQPVRFRDQTTGKPLDLNKYPKANIYSLPGYQGSPWVPHGLKDPVSGYTKWGGGWTPQQAHHPEFFYIAYLATGDLGFLEDLQFHANFMVISDATKSIISPPWTPLTPAKSGTYVTNDGGKAYKCTKTGTTGNGTGPTGTLASITDGSAIWTYLQPSGGAILFGEERGLAWGFRTLLMAWRATKDAEIAGILPPTYHPSTYFEILIDNSIAFYSSPMTDPTQQVFRLIGGSTVGGIWSPWQVSYQLQALGFGALIGYTKIIPLYLWALSTAINFTNNTSGFPPGFGTPYRLAAYQDWKAMFMDMLTNPDPDVRKLTQAQLTILQADPLNGGKAFSDANYNIGTRAVLIQAAYLDNLGIVPVRATYPELDTCIANSNRMVISAGSMVPRDAVVVNAPNQQLPPKPTEIKFMTSTLALKIGESHHLTLAVTPADADLTGLVYRAVPDGVVTLAADATGVNVTRTAAGNVQIFADLNSLEAEADATFVPLATAISLTWD